MSTEAKKLLGRVNRRYLTEPIIKKLFALTGNECAMPTCSVKLVYEDVDKLVITSFYFDYDC